MENFKKSKVADELISFFKTILFSIIFVFIFVTFIAKPVKVVGSSMYPTLIDGQYGFSSVISLNVSEINRFDVVVIDSDALNELIVKRIIGLPGEHIVYKDEKLYIDDKYVEQDFLDQEYVTSEIEANGSFTENFEYTLANDQYFFMGDNRNHSTDSRTIGPITKQDIVCKSIFTLLPFNKFGDTA